VGISRRDQNFTASTPIHDQAISVSRTTFPPTPDYRQFRPLSSVPIDFSASGWYLRNHSPGPRHLPTSLSVSPGFYPSPSAMFRFDGSRPASPTSPPSTSNTVAQYPDSSRNLPGLSPRLQLRVPVEYTYRMPPVVMPSPHHFINWAWIGHGLRNGAFNRMRNPIGPIYPSRIQRPRAPLRSQLCYRERIEREDRKSREDRNSRKR